MSDEATREGGPTTILVIDDDATNRYVVGSWLRRAGHSVIESPDGTQGLAALTAANGALPDLAIVDVHLPDMTGFEVCERIKADPATARVPVIHMSATAIAVSDRTQGLHRGADAYLTEPVDPEELLATITAVLRYTRARQQAESLASRLDTLNRATLELYRTVEFEHFAAAAAAGTASVMSAAAVAIFLSSEGEAVRVAAPAPGATPLAEPVKPEVLGLLGRRVLGPGIGAQIAVIPQAEWRALLPPGPLLEDVAVAVARAKHNRPAVCVAVDAGALRSPDDHRLLLQMAQACALTLEALRTYAEEHMLALALQRSFLPDRLPRVPGVELAVRYVPATSKTEIGGDFYEAIETEHGLLVAIGDVVGHSLDAAIMMGEVRHALRAYAVEGHPPDVILSLLDTLVTRLRPDELVTVTLCLLLVEPGGRRIRVSNAGHIPPLLLTPGGGDRFLPERSALLGLELEHPPSTVHEIDTPSRIVLITDGLVEVRNTVLTDSLAAFQAAVRTGPADIEALCDQLLLTFGRNNDDDIALLVLDLS